MSLIDSTCRGSKSLRGGIWYIEFDPTKGGEIKKTRPGVIVSLDEITNLGIRLVVPVRKWKPSHNNMYWRISLEPTIKNGIEKKSTADVLQTRCLSTNRFVSKIGTVSAEKIEDIVAALAAIIDYV